MDEPPQFHGRQLTAARALAGLTIVQFADDAGVTVRTIWRLENEGPIHISPGRRHGHVSWHVWRRIVSALEAHGVELLPATDDHGAGARWAEPGSAKN